MTAMYISGMNEQEIAIFEQQCRSRGCNTRKEGKRYCECVVNEMLQAVVAFKQAQAVAWLAEYVDREGNSKWYVSTHKDLATENDMNADPKPLYTHPTQQGLYAPDKQWKETRLVGALGEMIAHVTWDGKNPPVFSITRGKFVDSGSRVLSAHAACHALGVFLQEHADALAAQAKRGEQA